MTEFLDHAKNAIKGSPYLFIDVPQPTELLDELKKTIKKLNRD
jgi:hypothetical protein